MDLKVRNGVSNTTCTSLIAQGLEQEFACPHGYLLPQSKNTIFDPVKYHLWITTYSRNKSRECYQQMLIVQTVAGNVKSRPRETL
jgi:hypothetical protein